MRMRRPVVVAAAANRPTWSQNLTGRIAGLSVPFFSPMPARYFTLEEANALLPKIKPLMDSLLTRRAKAAKMSRQVEELFDDLRVDRGGPILSELAMDFAIIERQIAELQNYGCVIKDLNGGLVDFLAERNGREVYLCWRFGEDRIEYYHELHTGFQGRRKFWQMKMETLSVSNLQCLIFNWYYRSAIGFTSRSSYPK